MANVATIEKRSAYRLGHFVNPVQLLYISWQASLGEELPEIRSPLDLDLVGASGITTEESIRRWKFQAVAVKCHVGYPFTKSWGVMAVGRADAGP